MRGFRTRGSGILGLRHAARNRGLTRSRPQVATAPPLAVQSSDVDRGRRFPHLRLARPPMRVLVVDDDPDFRSYVLAGLKRAGIDCEGASDGAMAKQLLDRVGVEPFDLILLDVKMPGQSGWDLLLELRELGRETPVIFLSGLDSVEERVKGLRLGADDYIAKEFDFDELVARIGAVIRRRRSLAPIEYA